jgi:hypothetical protein
MLFFYKYLEAAMGDSAKDKVLSRIYGKGKGWVFSATDFTLNLSRWKVDRSLADLAREGKIRRIMQGLYDYPKHSDILKKEMAPDIQKAAEAIARKYGWRIYPDGNTALNYLGLSTQVVAKNIYLSDGPSRKCRIGARDLFFKHTTTKEAVKYSETALVIQAIKAIGEKQVTDDFLSALSQKYSIPQWARIKKDAAKATGWVYEQISRIAGGLKDGQNG